MTADIAHLFKDKSLRAKEKTALLSSWLISQNISAGELVVFADAAKDPAKASCIEALEFATKQQPSILDEQSFLYVMQALCSEAPRVKWEAAKVIGNTAGLFPHKLEQAIGHLLNNAAHEGTVVRWSAAFALGAILQLRNQHYQQLLPALKAIAEKEEKSSIQKIYLKALAEATG